MIETRHLKNVIFIQTMLSFVLSRKIIDTLVFFAKFFRIHPIILGNQKKAKERKESK